MAIYLFTDFGAADLYVGQVKAALHRHAPGVAVIDLLHEAPAFGVEASAHLLAALAEQVPPGSVVLAVVDPGVGGPRVPVAVHADRRWFVGPDNGLLSVTAARAAALEVRLITWRPPRLSASFHGRDLFAPVAGMLAAGTPDAIDMEGRQRLDVDFGSDDLGKVIYIDHYGNVMTGLRAAGAAERARTLLVEGRRIDHARVFSDAPGGAPFWYENSIGLIEIAANRASAAAMLGLSLGQAVRWGGL